MIEMIEMKSASPNKREMAVFGFENDGKTHVLGKKEGKIA